MEELKTFHKVIIGDSREMEEVEDESVHLIVTSPLYPMIEMWDDLFRNLMRESIRLGKRWRLKQARERRRDM